MATTTNAVKSQRCKRQFPKAFHKCPYCKTPQKAAK